MASSPSTTSHELVTKYADKIRDKIILTTGVTQGSLGAAFIESIAAAKPGMLVLAGRTPEKIQRMSEIIASRFPDVKLRSLFCDLASHDSVRKASAELNGWDDVARIDIMINSAGIMKVPYQRSPDGHELQLATNYLGHFLFTNLIMNKIMAAESPRIIILGSDSHRMSPIRWGDINFDNGEFYNGWAAYGQSKTAAMLMAKSLAEKLGERGLLAFSIHPGTVLTTNLVKHLDFSIDMPDMVHYDQKLGNVQGFAENGGGNFVSAEQAAATYIYAAFEPSLKSHNGGYIVECRLADPYIDVIRPWATSETEADMLWKLSEKLVGERFSC